MSSLAHSSASAGHQTNDPMPSKSPSSISTTTTTAAVTQLNEESNVTEHKTEPANTSLEPDDLENNFEMAINTVDSESNKINNSALTLDLNDKSRNTTESPTLKSKQMDTSNTNKASDPNITHQQNTSAFNGLSIDNFQLEELQKETQGGISLQQPTPSEISNILAVFPDDGILDQKVKSNNKNEEEAETIHLQQSPPNTDSLVKVKPDKNEEPQRIQAYALLDFDSFTFYVQTMQILLGRMVEGDALTDALDIHLGNQKAISRRHAKIFYNFGNQRFELSVLGRNGAFVDGNFVEKGVTVPLADGTKIQIGETEFAFVLPQKDKDGNPTNSKNATDNQMDNLDNLVANFDDLRKDLQDDKLLMDKDSNALNMVLDPDTQMQRELEIEKEIGKVLEHATNEHSNNNTQFNDETNIKQQSTSKTTQKSSSDSKSKDKTKPKRQPKAKKKVYSLEEIPEQYRNKPNLPYSIMITECLRQKGTERGMSLSEIYKGIQELYPYYFYCPDGWQSSVRHNLSLNKCFRKISKEGKGWLWGVNEEVIAEKDRARQKQIENARLKGKTLSSINMIPKPLPHVTQKLQANLHIHNPTNKDTPTADTNNSTVPQPIQATITSNTAISSNTAPVNPVNKTISQPVTKSVNTPTPSTSTSSSTSNANNNNMSANTKKALAYLQKELISLTKSRKMYDRATSTEILTKALAMTISQVDQAAKNFSIKGFPLVILIEKNPGHVTKILTAALNAATLQVCKQKGLTPHLPSKTQPQQSTSKSQPQQIKQESSQSTKQRQGSNSNIKQESRSNSTTQQNISSTNQTISSSSASKNESVVAYPVTAVAQTPSKPSAGPVVYQFSKPSFKPTVKPISGTGIKPIKPVRLNDNNVNSGGSGITAGTGIIKPQFYTKNKSNADAKSGGGNTTVSEQEENRKMMAKFEKPTPEPKMPPAVKKEEGEGDVVKAEKPTDESTEKAKAESKNESENESESENDDSDEDSEDESEGHHHVDVVEDDELDDELHMMLADLEKSGEPNKSVEATEESKKRNHEEVDDDKQTLQDEGNDEKRVKIE